VKSFSAPGGEVFKGAGRPELGLTVGILQIAIAVPALIVLVRTHGVEGGALAMLIAIAVCGVVKLGLALRLLQGGIIELGRALAPSFLCSGVLAAALLVLMPTTDQFGRRSGCSSSSPWVRRSISPRPSHSREASSGRCGSA
jgi:hypothetical protein